MPIDVQDPFKSSAATVLRPRPGAGRRGAADVTAVLRQPVVQAPTENLTVASAAARARTGLNPLVQAASPLLLLAAHLRGSASAPDVGALRRHALDAIRRFEESARAAAVAREVVVAARYLVCASLDEAVLTTPWGGQSEWAQQPLLVTLHREAWGGQKFFDTLERLSSAPERHIDLLELQYLCIAFGFAGKYQVDERGHARLADIQHALYRQIRTVREMPPAELSPRWKGLQDRRNPVIRYVPWWAAAVATVAVLTMTFVFYYTRLGTLAGPVHQALAIIGTEDFTTPATTPPASGPSLKQLLASEEGRAAVAVEEHGGRSVVTLLSPTLFASASAALGREHEPTVRAIAAALNRVPGRVLVVGHTDNQPLKSLTYADNFELSRERAVTVVKVLARDLDDRRRLEWTGVGPSEPRYRPEADPANRMRNRRVEIIHVRES